MLKRIKRHFQFAKLPENAQENALEIEQEKVEEGVYGDGKAEFLGEGSQEEFEQMQKADKGLKGIFGL